jgi:hypothetical protein
LGDRQALIDNKRKVITTDLGLNSITSLNKLSSTIDKNFRSQ